MYFILQLINSFKITAWHHFKISDVRIILFKPRLNTYVKTCSLPMHGSLIRIQSTIVYISNTLNIIITYLIEN